VELPSYQYQIARPIGLTRDIMDGAESITIQTDSAHGFISLVDCMPRIVPADQFADYAVVQAARTSYGQGTKQVNEDRGLIRYLMRHMHTTPFEMVEFKFHCQMPIFIARQWIRHRTANVNEVSARYSEMPGHFWIPKPEDVREQSSRNKQVSEGQLDLNKAEQFVQGLETTCSVAYERYQRDLFNGVGKEIARAGLPVNLYTRWYWKCDLHNIFHFLGLRMHSHAQKEIRDYANAMFALISPLVPTAAKAFLDYHHLMGGMKLSALEIAAIREGSLHVAGDNKREQAEFEDKLERLGLKS
jgi:thymidylate synthase (FAD)